ncbi:hypothetical protein GIB67_023600 [Kingdonia uniflora]|uniref:ABC-2 type transporter transmembrane domain-containing protein n=1 Tax=Kingdonia uniflora TaxID=39325 RepID=A0A7J7L4W9_9MAGN|nr:hypothetical protein GIB67_023600 [Kingdonia uniflora]
MKRGGQVTYMGPRGRDSHKLVEYFQDIPGITKIKDGYNPATWMVEISTASVEVQLDIDFAELYSNSSLYQQTKPGAYQRAKYNSNWCSGSSYWRNPRYNAIRFFMTIVIGFPVPFGIVFWNKGQKTNNQQDLVNILGGMYAAVLFLGASNVSAVQFVVSIERTVFYRERAAGMYLPLPYAFAQVAIEAIYFVIQTFVYTMLLYSMIGFHWELTKFLYFYYFILMCFIYFVMISNESKRENVHQDGFDRDFLGYVVLAYVGFVCAFFFVFAYSIKFFNFQRR